jgi:hypothetical protein
LLAIGISYGLNTGNLFTYVKFINA